MFESSEMEPGIQSFYFSMKTNLQRLIKHESRQIKNEKN